MARKRLRIGELLVGGNLLTEEQLATALREQKKRGARLGRVLIDLGFIEEKSLLDFLAKQLNIPYVDLTKHTLDPEAVKLLPETHARRFRAIVLRDTGKDAIVGLADATDIMAHDELARILRKPVRIALVREDDLLRALDSVYRRTGEISNLAEQVHEDLSHHDIEIDDAAGEEKSSDAPVARLLKSIFEDAVQMGASDIHIEPGEGTLRIRQRVDGFLHEQVMKEARIAPALVLRIKLMSSLDISEKRLPQDGRFNIKVGQRPIDVRVSTLPIQHGEAVVMRLLDQSSGTEKLGQLGIPQRMLERIRNLIHRPHGLLLVTGPTGSGKTTTLYAALRELNLPEKKIITVEDPVEYRLPRINQVHINAKIDLTFARVLRAALRQDPDVIMIGEMRDAETAEIGLRAAMTGHFVLSTLHTNDALSTPLRLVDMGVEGYLAASSLLGVIAQRLVRRICEQCSEPYAPNPQECAWLSSVAKLSADDIKLHQGAGCNSCNNTGYRGRIGVYELLELDVRLADALRKGDPASYAQAAREQKDFRPLALATLDYAREGVTTLQEVFRLSAEIEEEPLEAEVEEADSTLAHIFDAPDEVRPLHDD